MNFYNRIIIPIYSWLKHHSFLISNEKLAAAILLCLSSAISIQLFLSSIKTSDIIKINFSTNSSITTNQDNFLANLPPQILGQREACLICHAKTIGLQSSHDIQAIGCFSCHLGNPFSLDKDLAHRGLILVPGNLASAKQSCGQDFCHSDIVNRVEHSLMASGSGIVGVNRFVFGQRPNPDSGGHLQRLENDIDSSPADHHLRRLCAACHLSQPKKKPGPVDQLSRGGGCNACHIQYELNRTDYSNRENHNDNRNNFLSLNHPKLSIRDIDSHCFGCHSRSGRIATNFEGWHETHLSEKDYRQSLLTNNPTASDLRLLQDGRVFTKMESDVHFKLGIGCTDCHNSYELMGDGQEYNHKEQALHLICQDCHPAHDGDFLLTDKLNSEESKLVRLYGITDIANQTRQFIKLAKTGKSLINGSKIGNAPVMLTLKNGTKSYQLSKQNAACQDPAHTRLSCQSCHSAWAPHCISCHTQYDSKQAGYDHLLGEETSGTWFEYHGQTMAELPSLGVMGDKITTFIPGMNLTINKNDPIAGQELQHFQIFRRLYAPIAPHTSAKQVRSCQSCHHSSLAIGLGRGQLNIAQTPNQGHVWQFQPKYELMQDGLPVDAWIGWGQHENQQNNTTRGNARSFNRQEISKILRVGACLQCHPANGYLASSNSIYNRWQTALDNITASCISPDIP